MKKNEGNDVNKGVSMVQMVSMAYVQSIHEMTLGWLTIWSLDHNSYSPQHSTLLQ